MSWRKRKTMMRTTALHSALLFAALTGVGVMAIERGWLDQGSGARGAMAEFNAGFRAGQRSNIPLEMRLRQEQGWSIGTATVTGARHLRVGDQEFALAYVEPLGGAAAALDRLVGGKWVACTPVKGAYPPGADCVDAASMSVARALIDTGKAQASRGAPFGLRI